MKILDDKKTLEIQIVDSGLGIPSEIQVKMMEAFYTTKPAGVGTGLGLNISRRIIQDHDGKLFYNPEDKNTNFTIQIPCTEFSI